ncbi:conjugal transfer protein TrbM [Bordetella ansorpii]|uniref:Conjugal transfer protein TrbM n=1 Tax=Bordetella ansorpii TaxID=288768 RepID=A0A157SRW6_9BORD|nr:TrbM/KikA/MpfK family conjugal transfer protein [Bordetella ansorpii]SAI73182.1 conjugal transfer protein TrbM [Bordetella ansorpii]
MRISYSGAAIAALATAFAHFPAMPQDIPTLTGTTRLACEALLCLSSGTRPSECSPSLGHYFGIKHRKFSDTLDARRAFLAQCPTVRDDPEMSSLARALVDGAGRCDAVSLNAALGYTTDTGRRYVTDKMPTYCQTMYSTPYTADLAASAPIYIGTPQDGGYWVERADYESELRKYQEQLERAKQEMNSGNGGA